MSFAGTWNIVMKTPMGDREIVMVVTEDGDSLSGTMEADGNTLDMQDGKLADGRGTWKADLTHLCQLHWNLIGESMATSWTGR